MTMDEPDSRVDREEILRRVRVLLPELRRHGARRIWLFGSRARGEAAPGSDWDFLVEFVHAPGFDDFMNLKLLLEDRLGGRVNLLSRKACRPRFLAAIQGELIDAA